eukprot:GHRQ01023325.1.p4 GENE.GHRQ01023325.1~~GHRQ01023325.1.p4  ORF type:complete len:127 (-),score=38.46 GHRQ01023325.1:92-472(-)
MYICRPHSSCCCPHQAASTRVGALDSVAVPLPPTLLHKSLPAIREGVDIQDAYKLLSPTLGARAASIVFALALLASGQNSTITGTLAGQVVMEGFLQVRVGAGVGWVMAVTHRPDSVGHAAGWASS